MALSGVYQVIDIKAGVEPITDRTGSATEHYTYSDKIRFQDNKPEKIGGYMSQLFNNGSGTAVTPTGTIRTIFSDMVSGKFYYIIGSNTNLYAAIGSGLYNISPTGLTAGQVNESASIGYGAGKYGVGLYGTALVSTSAKTYPRIWFVDRYANTFVMTPGNQGGLYQWFGDIATPPVQITNAPTAINYVFVLNNTIVTFGAANGGNSVENRIFASDITDITVWTSSSTNTVFDDDIEGAGRLTSHCPFEDYALIFTENKTYSFRYIGTPLVWEIKPVDDSIGIIASMARVPVKGMAIWMGQDNFYMYRGGKVEIIPANDQYESTMKNYVFNNINVGQKSKIFAWYNVDYNEVWFHYPSSGSNEPDQVAVVNMEDYTWAPHTFSRTAAEGFTVKTPNPMLANGSSLIKHEIGTDADGSPLSWTLTSDIRYYGKNNANVNSIIPDSNQIGNVTFTDYGRQFPQSVNPTYNNNYTVTPTTERVTLTSTASFHQYTWAGSELGQTWQMGDWIEEIQTGPGG